MGCSGKPGAPIHGPSNSKETNTTRVATDEGNSQVAKPNDEKVPIEKALKKPKVSNKVKEALMLPTCMNLNPRSIYNKVTELITFIKEKQVHCVFLSESWERPEFNLNDLIHIEDFKVISNPMGLRSNMGPFNPKEHF